MAVNTIDCNSNFSCTKLNTMIGEINSTATEVNNNATAASNKANEASTSANTSTQEADRAKQEADRAEAAANSITVTNGAIQPMVFLTADSDGQSVFNLNNAGVLIVALGGVVMPLLDSRTDTTITIKTDVVDIKAGDELGFLVIT
jgi:hypothetical protein